MIFEHNLWRFMVIFVFATTASSIQRMDEQWKRENHQKYPFQVHQMFKEQIQKKTPRNLGEWSDWSPWSPCSRSCGGGITQQTRHCIHRPSDSRFVRRQRRRRQHDKNLNNGCVGVYKRIHLCNSEDCPTDQDFRYEQCASFNNRPFRGTIYQWEPFFKAKDECALNCRAVGMHFFAILNKTVIDGTSCQFPVTHTGKAAPKGTRGICIDGYCKVVNFRGVIGSLDDEQEDCSACSKNFCRRINGIYTKSDLPLGYSLVAQIPVGACKILIQQSKHTRNFIALKTSNGSYIVNGNWKLENSRVFHGAGATFVYTRQDENSLETITSQGPLIDAIDIMIVNYQVNPGIKYSYSQPTFTDDAMLSMKRPNNVEPNVLDFRQSDSPDNTSSSRTDEVRPPQSPIRRTRLKQKHFHWKITGLTACSKSCGGGIQTYVKTCIREAGHSQIPVPDIKCSHLHSSTSAPIRCNTASCPAVWKFYWSDCSVTCGEGIQQYIPQCKQGSVVVSEDLCTEIKPSVQARTCRENACDNHKDNEVSRSSMENDANTEWTTGAWSSCSVSCGVGYQTRPVTCSSARCRPEDRPAHAEYCDMGSCVLRETAYHSASSTSISTWLLTDWSQCSDPCGVGNQTRLAVCGFRDKDSCPLESKPDLSRACASEKQCEGQWFTGPWGLCLEECSDRATQKREIFCVIRIRGLPQITNDQTCSSITKPSEEQACASSCPPKWYFGDWRQCEGTCPNSIQRREIRCLDQYGRDVKGCSENDKPISKRECICATDIKERYKPVHDEPVNDRYCVDKIHKCKLAVQARLCHYPYYITYCCESCRRIQEPSN